MTSGLGVGWVIFDSLAGWTSYTSFGEMVSHHAITNTPRSGTWVLDAPSSEFLSICYQTCPKFITCVHHFRRISLSWSLQNQRDFQSSSRFLFLSGSCILRASFEKVVHLLSKCILGNLVNEKHTVARQLCHCWNKTEAKGFFSGMGRFDSSFKSQSIWDKVMSSHLSDSPSWWGVSFEEDMGQGEVVKFSHGKIALGTPGPPEFRSWPYTPTASSSDVLSGFRLANSLWKINSIFELKNNDQVERYWISHWHVWLCDLGRHPTDLSKDIFEHCLFQV